MTDEQSIEDIRKQKLEELQSKTGGESVDSSASSTPSEPIYIDGSSHLSEVVNSHNLVLTDFYADWCGPCQMIDPIVTEIAAETGVTVAKVDIDDHQQLAAQYGVQGVPTLILFNNGDATERLVGMQQKPQLMQVINKYKSA
ncbi:thioredoxin [Salinarchaeum sp. IM2453]|uniref:thioredoxin n=1 Tax=Salinarchaeum sp. IM2453 TaxID=2862870 RepID=UPI001C82CEF3|nr:thioredoxin [Salinarchaeum sp. IM2453]QZA87716.1 thioredoxin [Salinarchaeum sp. IM2453]